MLLVVLKGEVWSSTLDVVDGWMKRDDDEWMDGRGGKKAERRRNLSGGWAETRTVTCAPGLPWHFPSTDVIDTVAGQYREILFPSNHVWAETRYRAVFISVAEKVNPRLARKDRWQATSRPPATTTTQ